MGQQNEPKTFRGQEVRLTDLLANREDSIVDGYTFKDCEIFGPAVVVLDRTDMTDIRFMLPTGGSIEAALFEVANTEPKIGIVSVRNCRFANCVFDNVAFAGTTRSLAPIRKIAGA